MNPKQDRPGARTPADLERKYNFGENFHDIKETIAQQNIAMEKQSQLFANYVGTNDKALQALVENYGKLLEKVNALEKSDTSQKEKIESLEKSDTSIQSEMQKYWETVYPVGAIYLSVSEINPSTLFGGTWEQIEDRFLLASGSSYAAGSTGGEATHKLTVAEMPSHKHLVTEQNYNVTLVGNAPTSGAQTGWFYGSGGNSVTGAVGNSEPHNNMPPYLAVFVWKRTA